MYVVQYEYGKRTVRRAHDGRVARVELPERDGEHAGGVELARVHQEHLEPPEVRHAGRAVHVVEEAHLQQHMARYSFTTVSSSNVAHSVS